MFNYKNNIILKKNSKAMELKYYIHQFLQFYFIFMLLILMKELKKHTLVKKKL